MVQTGRTSEGETPVMMDTMEQKIVDERENV